MRCKAWQWRDEGMNAQVIHSCNTLKYLQTGTRPTEKSHVPVYPPPPDLPVHPALSLSCLRCLLSKTCQKMLRENELLYESVKTSWKNKLCTVLISQGACRGNRTRWPSRPDMPSLSTRPLRLWPPMGRMTSSEPATITFDLFTLSFYVQSQYEMILSDIMKFYPKFLTF